MNKKVKVALIGYGVIGKRVADAVALQDDMELTGVADVISDWRIQAAVEKGFPIYYSTEEAQHKMRQTEIPIAGAMDELLGMVDVVLDCTPKKIAAQNVETYKKLG